MQPPSGTGIAYHLVQLPPEDLRYAKGLRRDEYRSLLGLIEAKGRVVAKGLGGAHLLGENHSEESRFLC